MRNLSPKAAPGQLRSFDEVFPNDRFKRKADLKFVLCVSLEATQTCPSCPGYRQAAMGRYVELYIATRCGLSRVYWQLLVHLSIAHIHNSA